jgi:hypothetical protein
MPIYRACFTLIYAYGVRLSEAVTLPISAVDSNVAVPFPHLANRNSSLDSCPRVSSAYGFDTVRGFPENHNGHAIVGFEDNP